MPGRPFQPGHAKLGGRKKDTPNKMTKSCREFLAETRQNPEWQESAYNRMVRGKAPHLETLMVKDELGEPATKIDATVTFGWQS